MRKLVFIRDGRVLGLMVLCFLFESGFCSELSGNGSNIVSNATTSGRGSRQLWSLVKNVIKTGLEGSSSGGNAGGGGGSSGGGGGSGGVGAGLGALASLFGSAIANGINSDGVGGGQYNQYQGLQQQQQQYQNPNPNPNQFQNPNDYMHYLLMNSQNNQHASLPHYFQQQQKEQESTADLIEKYKEQMASGTTNVETATNTGNQLLSNLAMGSIFDDLDKVSNFLSFSRVEGMVEKINKFDKLKCIPRLLCQMVSKRKEDEKKEEEKQQAKAREDKDQIATTTLKSTNRKADEDDGDAKEVEDDEDKKSRKDEEEDDKKVKKESEEDDEEEEDDDDDEDDSEEVREYVVIKKGAEEENKRKVERKGKRNGRFLKLNGSDTALEQFVRFLDLMQLKDWSLYPYLNGAYQGHQVTRTEECAYRFSSCPFSDEQLVYYFNNYNGGFFQSI